MELVNEWNGIGRICRGSIKSGVKDGSKGLPVRWARFRMACWNSWRKKHDFLPVFVRGKTAERLLEKFTEGDRIGVTGKIRNDVWTDKEGKQHWGLEITADKIYFIEPLPSGSIIEGGLPEEDVPE